MSCVTRLRARLLLCTVFVMLFAVSWAQGQTASAGPPTKNDPQNLLDQFSGAVESMVRRVSPAVVQVLATTYSLGNEGSRSNVNSGVEQRVASGVIVAADGYIMTNAHVVQDAHTIRVRLVSANPVVTPRFRLSSP
jgi:S1-C subfamily serine protease